MPTVDPYRGTGRTTRMLDRVAAFVPHSWIYDDDQASSALIVVSHLADARFVERALRDRRLYRVSVWPVPVALSRIDGGPFIGTDLITAYGGVFIDHWAWETRPAETYLLAEKLTVLGLLRF